MPDYRRAWQQGGTYFFTVVLHQRRGSDLLTRHIALLRQAVREVRHSHPFVIHAWVVLPEHLHCIIELPAGDTDFAVRWRLIKMKFSEGIPARESRNASRIKRGERGIWQRRYWEHLIRDADDYAAHMDYAHLNPLKHGLVTRVCDWPYSTFHRLVSQGVYPANWAGGFEDAIAIPD
ncbi:hypothetical protein IMCC9480_967 [Oxalobacteraceae bacterium IMCC9480]|nr:hypothetical protein IMCC9480_967 [Oxalobacteraceae bacterium IMCC9480]